MDLLRLVFANGNHVVLLFAGKFIHYILFYFGYYSYFCIAFSGNLYKSGCYHTNAKAYSLCRGVVAPYSVVFQLFPEKA